MATFSIGGGIQVGGGITIDIDYSLYTTGLLLHLDAGDPSSYPGSGSTWTDLVGSKAFTLHGSPTYSSSNGGYLNFAPASSQWANSSTSLSSTSTWTVEAWHYYNGTNNGTNGGLGACIVTEYFTGTPNVINFSLGNNLGGTSTDIQAGFFNGSWRNTASGYSLTANAWYHLVGTYDGSTIKFYVNRNLQSSTNYVGTPTSGGHGIRLMRRWDDGDYWGGRLSVVRIYDNALTQNQVTGNYNAQRVRFGL